KTVTPGFQDAHVHPTMAGADLLSIDLTGLTGQTEYLSAIQEYATSHPNSPWVTGGGWYMNAFSDGKPTRQMLDDIVPDRPVFLLNRDRHGAWVNSAALEYAGIDQTTSDPTGGFYER